jgi:hypothetical protein
MGHVLFSADAAAGLADGSITLTFRRWTRAQAKAGGRYRTQDLLLSVTAVERVAAATITAADAARTGEASLAALMARLGDPAPEDQVWRVELHCIGADDPLVRGAAQSIDPAARAAIKARLDRLDRASGSGPWTARTLRMIQTYPGVVSTALARNLGAERPAFKLSVRKLKELGLTESLEIGYRLSPLGEAFLSMVD